MRANQMLFRPIRVCASFALALLLGNASPTIFADDAALKPILNVERQPLAAHARRIATALELAGAPLSREQSERLSAAVENPSAEAAVKQIQELFDPLCLAVVNVNPESRVKVAAGPAPKHLFRHGWRVFLVKVHNEAGVTAVLRANSPNAAQLHRRATNSAEPPKGISPQEVENRWLDLALFDRQPLAKNLSGLAVEYRILSLYSRDAGKREAKLSFDVGQGTQDLGFRNELDLLFQCDPAVDVQLDIADDDGSPTSARFVIRDSLGRVYPAMTRRLAPDFFFHEQIYRASGETISLPPGDFQVEVTRGPEYVVQKRKITVPDPSQETREPPPPHREAFRLKRWIKLADHGWISGDHHVHAAGCAHYDSPTEGVQPQDMMRHILGEDLNVGCVLSWGPCWYTQKQYFEGKVHRLSLPRYLMRYDVEVSGFPSSHCGHLCLLRLKEDDYPGTTRIEEWPSWNVPILKWGKEQGGVVGYSHSGWGLAIKSTDLPSFEMPPFDGIGANEYIVDTVLGVCDFISAVDTPVHYELNIWYHTLNSGTTTRISGETDFPCIYGERVGLGRAYVKLGKQQTLDFDAWVSGLRDGRSYCCDGLSHLFDFSINGLEVGEAGAEGRASVLSVKSGEPLHVKLRAAALLEEQPRNDIRSRPLDQQPYWHVERARIGDTRKVPVELIVNGRAVERREVEANGDLVDVTFEYTPKFSSWVAVRILPSAHTNPIFVEVDGQPIRASKRSAQWCLDAVDVCWKKKQPQIRPAEREAAAAAFDEARTYYRQAVAAAQGE